MNSKKTMLAAALVVGVVALAGAGYAAFAGYYTATTESSNNDLNAVYLKLSQTGDGSYSAGMLTEIVFDTVNTGTVGNANTPVYTYKPVATHTYDSSWVFTATDAHHTTDETNYAAKISKDLTLNVDGTESINGASGSLTVTASSSFTTYEGLTYRMIITGAATNALHAELTGGKWTFSSVTLPTNTAAWVVSIYVTGSTADGVTIEDVQDAVFTFELKATVPTAGNTTGNTTGN